MNDRLAAYFLITVPSQNDPKPSPAALQSGRRNRLKPPFSWATRGLKILKFDAFKRGQGLRPLKPALLPISAFEFDQRLSW